MLSPDTSESPDNRTEWPPDQILFRLGIHLPDLAGKRVLDLGCGPTGQFVHFLREHGVDAYGLDSRSVISSPFLFQAEADKIPKPDFPYDLITAHFSVFRLGVSGFIETMMQQKRLSRQQSDMNLLAMEQILNQMAWISKLGSKAIIVPFPDELVDFLPSDHYSVEDILPNLEKLIGTVLYLHKPCPALGQRLIISY